MFAGLVLADAVRRRHQRVACVCLCVCVCVCVCTSWCLLLTEPATSTRAPPLYCCFTTTALILLYLDAWYQLVPFSDGTGNNYARPAVREDD